jgi:hypothetical protein
VKVNKKFFMKIIEQSHTGYFGGAQFSHWIPAIEQQTTKTRTGRITVVSTTRKLHVHHLVKELSDGQRIMFVN